ncbi:hypothetical protein DAEQUDRAFT_724265 [Daedalea quercina L-15889]|uniref:Uncharacterized protein n=1 Tax=Daedalea quercina L-15889 TaxID=1314783 RepID=A0A165RYT7_9APHY|nr:hypothetical protein DAEQUDRAFT_724265 [Daedalea quercina L-15889]
MSDIIYSSPAPVPRRHSGRRTTRRHAPPLLATAALTALFSVWWPLPRTRDI